MNRSFSKKAARLAKIMNTKSTFSVPVIKVILECFEIAFTETDLDRLLLMDEGEYTKEQLSTLWGIAGAEFDEYFKATAAKGVLWQRSKEGCYELSPIFPGWIEIFASGPENEQRKALIAKFKDFENVLKMLNIPPVRAYMNRANERYLSGNSGRMTTMVSGSLGNTALNRGEEHQRRTISVNASIDAENAVMRPKDLYPMLEKHEGHISVMNCFCRMMKAMDGKPCSFDMPTEGCVVVGRMSDMLVDTGVSRSLTFDEAVRLMDECEKKGCIHTVYHYGISSNEDELIICNCCTDCCFLYGGFRDGALSQLIMKAYYRPQIQDISECVGCDRCGKFCPTGATHYDKGSRKLEFDIDRCIGCGQCVTQCPKPVRVMVYDERNVFVKTPKIAPNKQRPNT